MSMWVNLARVTPEAFEQIRRDPHLLGPLFLEQNGEVLGTLGVTPEDISGLDYDSAADMIDAIAELADEEKQAARADAADDADGEDAADDDEGADADDGDDEDPASDDEAPAATEAPAAATGAEDDDDDEEVGDLVLVDLHIAGTLPYDAGFGSAFFLTPEAAKAAAGSSSALQLDDEAKAIVQAAGERGHYIVGVVS